MLVRQVMAPLSSSAPTLIGSLMRSCDKTPVTAIASAKMEAALLIHLFFHQRTTRYRTASTPNAQAKDVVEAKPGKLDFEVEQNGRNLSGGQKQRLTIARALVSKPDILILDDSLSALDFATDAALRKAIGELEGNVTTFLVSQRISGIRQADKILVMDDGELAGQGTHEELMETCETYQEIYYSQFPEERPVVMKTSEKTEKGAAE